MRRATNLFRYQRLWGERSRGCFRVFVTSFHSAEARVESLANLSLHESQRHFRSFHFALHALFHPNGAPNESSPRNFNRTFASAFSFRLSWARVTSGCVFSGLGHFLYFYGQRKTVKPNKKKARSKEVNFFSLVSWIVSKAGSENKSKTQINEILIVKSREKRWTVAHRIVGHIDERKSAEWNCLSSQVKSAISSPSHEFGSRWIVYLIEVCCFAPFPRLNRSLVLRSIKFVSHLFLRFAGEAKVRRHLLHKRKRLRISALINEHKSTFLARLDIENAGLMSCQQKKNLSLLLAPPLFIVAPFAVKNFLSSRCRNMAFVTSSSSS